jgi:replicative DNA helicase
MEQFESAYESGQQTTMPHAGDAERSVLGSMLIDANALEICLEQLREEDFYVPANAVIYAAMRDIRSSGDAVDLVTLSTELERHNRLDQAGGITYLTDLVTFVPTAANVQNYIELVETKSVQRQLIRAGGEIIRDGMDDEKELEDTLNAAERRIYDISMRKSRVADSHRPDRAGGVQPHRRTRAAPRQDHGRGERLYRTRPHDKRLPKKRSHHRGQPSRHG